MVDQGCAMIVDLGSHTFKAGLASEEPPSYTIPSVYGFDSKNEKVFGKKALELQDYTKIFKCGTILDWSIYEEAIKNIFSEEIKLNNVSEHPLLLIEPAFNQKLTREKLVQIAFEEFNVPALQTTIQPVLGLYSTGRTTGTIVDAGEDNLQILNIVDGYTHLYSGTRDRHFGSAGADVTDLLKQDLITRSIELHKKMNKKMSSTSKNAPDPEYLNRLPRSVVEDIKHNICYIDYFNNSDDTAYFNNINILEDSNGQTIHSLKKNIAYVLPDNSILELENNLCTHSPEGLFKPVYFNNLRNETTTKSLRDIRELSVKVFECIDSFHPVDYWKTLYTNIVLIGGSTRFANFSQRLHKELVQLTPPTIQTNVTLAKQNIFSAWLGGSILTMLGSFHSMWITAADYNANGPTVIHRKSLF